jgi:hypothetical protein
MDRSATGRTRPVGSLCLCGQVPGGTYMCAEVCWRGLCADGACENFSIFWSFWLSLDHFGMFSYISSHFSHFVPHTALHSRNKYSEAKPPLALTLGCVTLVCMLRKICAPTSRPRAGMYTAKTSKTWGFPGLVPLQWCPPPCLKNQLNDAASVRPGGYVHATTVIIMGQATGHSV